MSCGMPHSSSTSFAQTMVNQTPAFDKKRKPKKVRKKKKREGLYD